jgi:histidinol-phosphate phosphatase family protein
MAANRVVFLDKDGTLIKNVPYNVDPARIALARGAPEALAMFRDARLDVVVISNQPGIAFGRFTEEAMTGVRDRIAELLLRFGVHCRGLYYCPHHPDGSVPRYAVSCECRKPKCGLLLRAAAEHDIDLSVSWMVGDILDDVEAGRRAGCRTVLIDNGGETEWVEGPLRRPHVVVSDLARAARAIVIRTTGAAADQPAHRHPPECSP